MKTKDNDPKKKTTRKKAAPKKSATTKKVMTLEAARKRLDAAKNYKVTAEKNLLDAETPAKVQTALNTIQAGKNRIRQAKDDIREIKGIEKDNNGEKSKAVPIAISVAVIAAALAAGYGAATLLDSMSEGEDAVDSM